MKEYLLPSKQQQPSSLFSSIQSIYRSEGDKWSQEIPLVEKVLK